MCYSELCICITRKNCSETNTKAALDHYFKIVVYDGYVKYEEAEIHRYQLSCKISEIVKKKNKKKMADWKPFWIF